jgi:hypothetical protein
MRRQTRQLWLRKRRPAFCPHDPLVSRCHSQRRRLRAKRCRGMRPISKGSVIAHDQRAHDGPASGVVTPDRARLGERVGHALTMGDVLPPGGFVDGALVRAALPVDELPGDVRLRDCRGRERSPDRLAPDGLGFWGSRPSDNYTSLTCDYSFLGLNQNEKTQVRGARVQVPLGHGPFGTPGRPVDHDATIEGPPVVSVPSSSRSQALSQRWAL